MSLRGSGSLLSAPQCDRSRLPGASTFERPDRGVRVHAADWESLKALPVARIGTATGARRALCPSRTLLHRSCSDWSLPSHERGASALSGSRTNWRRRVARAVPDCKSFLCTTRSRNFVAACNMRNAILQRTTRGSVRVGLLASRRSLDRLEANSIRCNDLTRKPCRDTRRGCDALQRAPRGLPGHPSQRVAALHLSA